jgi:hypothetical protein
VPLLFAATLFVSASLLFMVQPMVAKMVLPLLGGSPAVWNACMVFFQLLLLLGYQYAHFVTGKYSPKKQWALHILVLAVPIAAFALAVTFGARRSPIAIAESLAPGGNSSPVLSVLALLTVAIAIPFFVVSTSAPLLQKWFGYTGHPSARDPYFLYSASNFGSLISLLGYPIFIEPNLSIVSQAWVFAGGFAVLTVMIFLCGRAAANPIGVPPASHLPAGRSGQQAGSQVTGREPPPSLARKLKWIALAFVPSSLMLGVTFHMTTDIASIPLLWVGPLALYLVTFIIAFGRVPDWFRVVIGNLAPVMILLLVFVMISKVNPGMGVELLLHLITFFAAALMCHYELARDRPSPEHLTTFFLLMSVGGVLGGIFNSLVAPVIFTHAFEYELVLIIACLLVPRLTEDEDAKEGTRAEGRLTTGRYLTLFGLGLLPAVPLVAGGWVAVVAVAVLVGALGTLCLAWLYSMAGPTGKSRFEELTTWVGTRFTRAEFNAVLDGAVPAMIFALYYYLRGLPGDSWYSGGSMDGPRWFLNLTLSLMDKLHITAVTVVAIIAAAGPVMMCFFFVDRPLRFALCVAAILGYSKFRQTYRDGNDIIYSERSFFGILKVEQDIETFYFGYHDREKAQFVSFKGPDGTPLIGQRYRFLRLVHGTTLHGQQLAYMPGPDGAIEARFIRDDFRMILPGGTPWDEVVVATAIHSYDQRQEPLTYYHRTGPVGAMYNELRTRKNGADYNADVAMVGLGTGSAACYAHKGQHLTFYEIDPAVERIVSDEAHDGKNAYFTFVPAARARGAKVTIRMGDARLKLNEDSDRKYALLLVDAFSSDSIPVHLLTTEAMKLYLDRMTEDGLLALHISNRWVRLEPVVSAIAKKLGLTARVWSDDNERGHEGKTASSWVVLARKEEYLGRLFSPLGDLPFALTPDEDGNDRQRYHLEATTGGNIGRALFDSHLSWVLVADFEELEASTGSNTTRQKELNLADNSEKRTAAWLGWGERKYADLCDPDGSQRLALFREAATPFAYLQAYRGWFQERLDHADTPQKQRLKTVLGLIREHGTESTLLGVMLYESGHGFRRLESLTQVEAWTDDYADVMRVMDIPGLQSVRRFFGLATPLKPR